MFVIAFEEYRAIGEDFIQIFLVREGLGTEHGVIPSAAKNPVIPRMFDGILAQSFLNLRGVFCAFKIHPAETQRAVHKVDVTIDETREHKFSAGVDDFCAHATPALDFRVVTDHGDLAVANGHGLGPRLLGVFGVNATVNDDDIRRFDDPALRARHPSRGEQQRERLKNDAKRSNFHGHLVLGIRMLAAC